MCPAQAASPSVPPSPTSTHSSTRSLTPDPSLHPSAPPPGDKRQTKKGPFRAGRRDTPHVHRDSLSLPARPRPRTRAFRQDGQPRGVAGDGEKARWPGGFSARCTRGRAAWKWSSRGPSHAPGAREAFPGVRRRAATRGHRARHGSWLNTPHGTRLSHIPKHPSVIKLDPRPGATEAAATGGRPPGFLAHFALTPRSRSPRPPGAAGRSPAMGRSQGSPLRRDSHGGRAGAWPAAGLRLPGGVSWPLCPKICPGQRGASAECA